jgi:16S rRNA C967 or C1407 C5-methylase (RsmB/RsmF family)
MFTRVLADAPCSGEGNYRCDMPGCVQHVRRATGTPDDLQRLQKQLLIRVFDMRAPEESLFCTI